MAGGRVERGSRRRTRAASAVVPFPRGVAGDRQDLARLVPSGRSLLLGFALVAGVLARATGAPARRPSSPSSASQVEGAPPAVAREVETAAEAVVGTSLLEVDARPRRGHRAGAPVGRRRVGRPRLPAHARRQGRGRSGPSPSSARGSTRVARHGRRARSSARSSRGRMRGFPRLWLPEGDRTSRVGGSLPASFTAATRALAAVAGGAHPETGEGGALERRPADARAPPRARDQARRARATCC